MSIVFATLPRTGGRKKRKPINYSIIIDVLNYNSLVYIHIHVQYACIRNYRRSMTIINGSDETELKPKKCIRSMCVGGYAISIVICKNIYRKILDSIDFVVYRRIVAIHSWKMKSTVVFAQYRNRYRRVRAIRGVEQFGSTPNSCR